MSDDGEWVKLSEWKADSAIVQSITAVQVWSTLTQQQRQLVAACRVLVDAKAKWPKRHKVILDGIKASAATMKSLERKGIVDEYGRLTIPGIYTALWNQLEADQKRREQRAKNRLAQVSA